MPTNEQLDRIILSYLRVDPGPSSWLLIYHIAGRVETAFNVSRPSSQKISGRLQSLARRGLLEKRMEANEFYPSEPTTTWHIPADD